MCTCSFGNVYFIKVDHGSSFLMPDSHLRKDAVIYSFFKSGGIAALAERACLTNNGCCYNKQTNNLTKKEKIYEDSICY